MPITTLLWCVAQVVYLEECEMCVVERGPGGTVTFEVQPITLPDVDLAATPRDVQIHHIDLSLDAIEKGGYKHCE
jgi:hypothetical protein